MKVNEDSHALFLQALTHKLLGHVPADAWAELVSAPAMAITFEYRRLTLLHAEPTVLSTTREDQGFKDELAWLAKCHGGELQPGDDGLAIVSFQYARSALRMGIGMQRMAPDLRFRIGLVTGICVVGMFEMLGVPRAVVLSGHLKRVAGLSRDASAGSVLLARETYESVRDVIGQEVTGCILMEEFDGPEVAQACVTPIPRHPDPPVTDA